MTAKLLVDTQLNTQPNTNLRVNPKRLSDDILEQISSITVSAWYMLAAPNDGHRASFARAFDDIGRECELRELRLRYRVIYVQTVCAVCGKVMHTIGYHPYADGIPNLVEMDRSENVFTEESRCVACGGTRTITLYNDALGAHSLAFMIGVPFHRLLAASMDKIGMVFGFYTDLSADEVSMLAALFGVIVERWK